MVEPMAGASRADDALQLVGFHPDDLIHAFVAGGTDVGRMWGGCGVDVGQNLGGYGADVGRLWVSYEVDVGQKWDGYGAQWDSMGLNGILRGSVELNGILWGLSANVWV